MNRLAGKVAVITGAGRGIGAAIASAFVREGAAVVLAELDIALARETAARIGSADNVLAVQTDVTQSASVQNAVSEAEAKFGPVDVLVNNAGIGLIRSIDDLTEADFDLTIAVNLKSAFLCIQRVIPGMRARKWGRIVNISSGAARGGGGIGPHYNASKAGMEGLTRGYAARLVKEGITVNAVAPSLIETDMVKQGLASSPARIPLGRFGTSEECAQVVMMLVRTEYMTGQTVALSGGMSFL
jgi:3-oxoacyl-[acyl-carrier protein] reductase